MSSGLPKWLTQLNREVVACSLCPRLVAYRRQVAREKRRAYRSWDYWASPCPVSVIRRRAF